MMDRDAALFYERLDSHWSESRPQGVSLVSIAGGLRDIQVRSGLASDPAADINTVTDAVPGAWVSADHRCIVWCKQLVLTINRALFDIINPVTRQITTDKQLRDKILHYHLVSIVKINQSELSSQNLPIRAQYSQNQPIRAW